MMWPLGAPRQPEMPLVSREYAEHGVPTGIHTIVLTSP